MSGNNNSWFHCGRCGSLFQSSIGDLEGRLCTECGRGPSIGFEAQPAETGIPQPAAMEESGHSGERERHSLRKRKKSHLMLKLVIGWTILLGSIIFGARWMFHDPSEVRKPAAMESPAKVAGRDEREVTFINEAGPVCNQVFSGFLTAGTPEARNQFVLSPIETASRMARFYALNPMANIDPSSLQLVKAAQLDLPGGKALETLWNSTEDRQFDAVFIKDGGEWRLDWDHFVRFSDYPWPLFLAGSGASEGEFRLLARERLAEERKNADTISIVLYAPRFGSMNDTGIQSPEFLIKRDSEDGRLLDAAFKLQRNGERVFGVKITSANPEGLVRVRVRIKRVEENMERHFELEKVVACHWYSIDDPGIKPAIQGDKK
ncbi:MAG: hypothetical protein ABIT37_05615 [Luteolibacter sp.]